MILSEAMTETEAFVSIIQQQFEKTGSWNMASIELGLRSALLKDGCTILEGLLNQPNALGTQIPSGKCQETVDDRSEPFRSMRMTILENLKNGMCLTKIFDFILFRVVHF